MVLFKLPRRVQRESPATVSGPSISRFPPTSRASKILDFGPRFLRTAILQLQDGVWNGERLLPEGFVKFVGTVASTWAADKRPIYGGFFWVNGTGACSALTRERRHR